MSEYEPVFIGLELAQCLPIAGSIDEVRIYNRTLTLSEVES